MPFSLLAEAKFPKGRHCVLLERTEQPSDEVWIGAFFYAPKGIEPGTGGIPEQPTVRELLDAIQPAADIDNLGFLILAAPPDTAQLEAFTESMLAAAERFEARGEAHIGGFVLWLDALGAFSLDQVFGFALPRDPISGPAGEGSTSYRLEPDTAHRLYDLRSDGRLLSVHADNLRSATLAALGDDDGLSFEIQGSLALRSADGGTLAALTKLDVDFGPTHTGCALLGGSAQAEFRVLEPGFAHALVPAPRFGTDNDAPAGRLYHPLLDPSETLANAGTQLVLDPLHPAMPRRNTVTLAPADGSFASAYRTRLAEVVQLTPTEGAHLQAAVTHGDRIYFAPAGTFGISVEDAKPAALLGGLSGVEFLRIAQGDRLVFVPGQDATVGYERDYDRNRGVSFSANTAEGPPSRQVSWAALVAAADTPETETWVSESERAPFFASESGEALADPLPFLPVALRSVPTDSATATATPYPLLPYAAVEPLAEGPGADASIVSAFEFGYASTRRRKALLSLTARPSGDSPARIEALTPQGYVATLRDGRITALTLGQIGRGVGSSATLCFDGGDEELPAALRDAFLANQQFIVITAATTALASYQATARLSGWEFTLDLPEPEDIVPGDYRTVLIVKSAAASVEELARQPDAWTNYEAFNNTSLDPSGEVLSAWITAYIDSAKRMYDGGKGVVGLQTFLDIVSARGWNGFVFLRVPVDTGALDPAIQFLLTGVDRRLFLAHHIGCAVNHAALEGGEYRPNSAYFGLVNYVRPGTDPGQTTSTPYVPVSADFDFQLLVLDAVFESSRITSFSSTARLILNRLFGDRILSTSPDPDVEATNTLQVLGSLQSESGTPRYVFATAKDKPSTLFPDSAGLERVAIERARISLGTGGGDDSDLARFVMSGYFALGDRGEGFDLLSYAGVPFDNLILTMRFPVGDDSNAQTSYTLDTNQLTIVRLPERALGDGERVSASTVASDVVYRRESLASELPVTITRLLTGTAGETPSELGFGDMRTSSSTGSPSFDGAWYAVELNLPLGSAGALGSGDLLQARMLFAWAAGGGGVDYGAYFRLDGPGGANLSLELQGVLKFGAEGVYLTRTEPEASPRQFVLTLSSIGLTVLTKTFPSAGSTNVYLAGFTDNRGRRSLGWFGAYVANS
jgi:hypothetical protein